MGAPAKSLRTSSKMPPGGDDAKANVANCGGIALFWQAKLEGERKDERGEKKKGGGGREKKKEKKKKGKKRKKEKRKEKKGKKRKK